MNWIGLELLSEENSLDVYSFEKENHDVYMHLIRDSQGMMVGRINLSVLESDRKTAELGYRIGEKYTNLGYASEAVKLVLDKAFHTYWFK